MHQKWNPQIWIWRDSSNNFANYFSIVVCLSLCSEFPNWQKQVWWFPDCAVLPRLHLICIYHDILRDHLSLHYQLGTELILQVRNNLTQKLLLCMEKSILRVLLMRIKCVSKKKTEKFIIYFVDRWKSKLNNLEVLRYDHLWNYISFSNFLFILELTFPIYDIYHVPSDNLTTNHKCLGRKSFTWE